MVVETSELTPAEQNYVEVGIRCIQNDYDGTLTEDDIEDLKDAARQLVDELVTADRFEGHTDPLHEFITDLDKRNEDLSCQSNVGPVRKAVRHIVPAIHGFIDGIQANTNRGTAYHIAYAAGRIARESPLKSAIDKFINQSDQNVVTNGGSSSSVDVVKSDDPGVQQGLSFIKKTSQDCENQSKKSEK